MADDDYEIISKRELDALRAESDKTKKSIPTAQPLGDGQSLLLSVNELNNNIRKLIDLFTSTESDLAKEYAEHNPVEDLREIKHQNEQLASAMLALADIVKEIKDDKDRNKFSPAMPPPAMPVSQIEQQIFPPVQKFQPVLPQQTIQAPAYYPAPAVPPDNIVNQDFIMPNSGLPPPPLDIQPAVKIGEKRRGFLFKK